MSDTDETKRPAKTLTLKKTETSTVKQSFSHGRTKAVVVEKKRTLGPAPTAAKAPEKPVPAHKPAGARRCRARPHACGTRAARRRPAPAYRGRKSPPRRRPGRRA